MIERCGLSIVRLQDRRGLSLGATSRPRASVWDPVELRHEFADTGSALRPTGLPGATGVVKVPPICGQSPHGSVRALSDRGLRAVALWLPSHHGVMPVRPHRQIALTGRVVRCRAPVSSAITWFPRTRIGPSAQTMTSGRSTLSTASCGVEFPRSSVMPPTDPAGSCRCVPPGPHR